MFQRYSFIIVFSCLITGLMWWSGQVESSFAPESKTQRGWADGPKPEAGAHPVADASNRRDLLEALDRIVAYEHYYRSVYGHFTKILSRVGYNLPASLTELYDVRVIEASRDRLLISAFSEVDGRTGDQVSVDQDFAVHAGFELPLPRAEYLRAQALKHLRALRDAPSGQVIEEQGVFKGFFRYEVKPDSQDRKVAFAVGLKAPVTGIQLEAANENGDSEAALGESAAEFQDLDAVGVARTGQRPVRNVMSTMEEAYLAQRIFRGEMGRYAKNWSELSKITKFKFAGKEQYGTEKAPFGDSEPVIDLDADSANRSVSSMTSSSGQELEIEPIVSDKTR